jgi:hypothetical protein
MIVEILIDVVGYITSTHIYRLHSNNVRINVKISDFVDFRLLGFGKKISFFLKINVMISFIGIN